MVHGIMLYNNNANASDFLIPTSDATVYRHQPMA